MNILILSWRGPKHPNFGGAEIATMEHAKAWVKAGNKVIWFTSSFKNASPFEKVTGVEIIRSGKQIFGVQIAAFYWYLFKKPVKFDLVIDQFHGLPFFTPLFVRTKKLAYIHEVAKDVWALNPWPRPFNLIPAMMGQFFEPLLFKMYKNISFMTVSESTKLDLISWEIPRRNIHVILNGINIIRPRKSIKKEKVPTFTFLGAVAHDKGIFDAMEVFAQLGKRLPKAQFWIIGKAGSTIKKQIKNIARKNDLNNRLKLWGFVSESKKFELLKKSHILINPSIREGWGLVNIESNAMGTPVVGYKVPGIVDSVKTNTTGYLVDKHDTNSLALSCEKLYSDVRYVSISKKCEKWASEFSWKKSTQQSLELINSIANAKRRNNRSNRTKSYA